MEAALNFRLLFFKKKEGNQKRVLWRFRISRGWTRDDGKRRRYRRSVMVKGKKESRWDGPTTPRYAMSGFYIMKKVVPGFPPTEQLNN